MSETAKPTRILCVDDHAFLVEGLKTRIDVEPNLEFVGRLSTADHLVREVKQAQADIVLLDIEMPGADVFEAIRELRRVCPDVRAILLSAHIRDRYLDYAFSVGAWGYLSKSDSPEAVIDGIRKVLKGETALSPALMDRAAPVAGGEEPTPTQGPDSRLKLLTPRELEILRLMAKGMSRVAIAEQLKRSPMTIDNHRKSIMSKLGIHDRVELVRYALAEKIVGL